MKRNPALRPAVTSYFQKADVNRKLQPKQHDIGALKLTEIYSLGFKSKTVTKSSVNKNSSLYFENDFFENCNGLLRDDCAEVRRSKRLLHKNFLINLHNKKLVVEARQPPRNRSKSLFKEINEKYKLHQSRLNNNLGFNLLTQLRPHIKVKDSRRYQKKIYAEVHNVRWTTVVKNYKMSDSASRKRVYTEDDKENFTKKFPILPKSTWIFQTPPNRKLTYRNPNVNDNNAMKPAVICRDQNTDRIYEMNPKIQIDLSNFSNKQEVPIDNRYMVPTIDQTDAMQEDCSSFKFSDHTSNEYELEQYFLGLTCRPKKPPSTVSRAIGCKRKRDIFEHQPENVTPSTEITELESNFAFLNNLTNLEESFTFKFTAPEHSEGAATGFLLDIDGKKKDAFDLPFFD